MSSFQAAPLAERDVRAGGGARARPDRARLAPGGQPRRDGLVQQRGHAGAPVFPGEIAIPILPADLRDAGLARLARQAQIAHRHDPRARLVGAVAIGEGVKLLDVTERMMRLRLDPGAQPACSERCDSSNGPAGKARASSVVSTLGSPLVTATSTATSSAWTERATDSVKAVSGEGGWAIKAPAGAGRRGSRPRDPTRIIAPRPAMAACNRDNARPRTRPFRA